MKNKKPLDLKYRFKLEKLDYHPDDDFYGDTFNSDVRRLYLAQKQKADWGMFEMQELTPDEVIQILKLLIEIRSERR